MKKYKKIPGFSLVEVTIVLAISVVMVGVIVGIYSQTRRVASDDATSQIISQFQQAYNEAKQGNGPSGEDQNTNNTFIAGDTLFGQAIEFRNNCGNAKACLRVYLLKMGQVVNGEATVSAYDFYDKAIPQGFAFNLTPNSACTDFVTCYATPGSELANLENSPISMNGLNVGLMIVVRNSTGEMYAFSKQSDELCEFNNTCSREAALASIGPQANSLSNYTPNRSGNVRLATGKPAGNNYNGQNNWSSADPKYYITFNLSNISDIVVSQQ